MFGVYSGKDPADLEAVQKGQPPFGLRPEFTPTLARMYAARAAQLPKPTKWFCVSNFFRAEKPQRGRLREFWQWNCDVLGGDDQQLADIEVLSLVVGLLRDLGITPPDSESMLNSPLNTVIRFSNRFLAANLLHFSGVPQDHLQSAMALLDRKDKISTESFEKAARPLGLRYSEFNDRVEAVKASVFFTGRSDRPQDLQPQLLSELGADVARLKAFWNSLEASDIEDWCAFDPGIVRGLAYYTGTVFEVIAEGERAVAGGGRYDNLIELFGGPPTSACGFGMGDAVLGKLLDDRKLIPEGAEMLEALARPMPLRPDAFVMASSDEAAAHVTGLTARLRRGEESAAYGEGLASDDAAKRIMPWSPHRYSVPPLHARRTYKATRNVGKLLADASACHARFAVIVESAERCTLKDLSTREDIKDVALGAVGGEIVRRTSAR
jgi:histidyl-tRNA synthetase